MPECSRDYERQPLRLGQSSDLEALRRALEANGYASSSLGATLDTGGSRGPLGSPEDTDAVLRRTAGGAPYDTLVRLFALARAVPEEAARAAVAPVTLRHVMDLGLLERAEEGVRAAVSLLPVGDLFVAHDFWPQLTGRASARDHVAPVSTASFTVGNLTVRQRCDTALDLGTGSGIQALWSARHADRVIATDTNPRALNLTAFGARLNGLSHIELRQGSLYEPVAGCQFGLIVANPPFLIAPRVDHEYRDSGLPGDAISEQVVRGAPALLTDGGYCTILFNWGHRSDDDWADRPVAWVEQSGCDAWILRSAAADPITYASSLLRQETPGDGSRYADRLGEWVAYIEGLGFESISWGAAILRRRRGGANWVRTDALPLDHVRGPCSDQIQRVFAAEDLVAELAEPAGLLDHAFVLCHDHELHQTLHVEKDNWMVQKAVLRQTEGFGFSVQVDRLISAAVGGCDGRRTLRQIVESLASDFGLPFEQIAPTCTSAARDLLALGFLAHRGERPGTPV